MKTVYYSQEPNFGDMLNKYVWPHFLAPLLEQKDDLILLGIGTIVGLTLTESGRVVVCGSGCGYQADLSAVQRDGWIVEFVRGPLSAAVLGLPATKGITDPAILTPMCLPPSPKTDRVVFIPHHITARSQLWKYACEQSGVEYIDPLDDVPSVVSKISSARLVITEAMHGAILADAYRVPWIAVRTSPHINVFKWMDWGLTHDLDISFVDLPPLGFANCFRIMTHSTDLEAALTREWGAENKAYKDCLIKHRYPSSLMTKVYLLLPTFVRHRLSRRLCNQWGPSFDRHSERFFRTGLFCRRTKEVAQILQRLSQQRGMLSADSVMRARQTETLNKLDEIKKRYLAV